MLCQNCNKETTNPKYCSRTCAVSKSNRTSPKRQPQHKCKTCQKLINSKRIYCSDKCKRNKLNYIDYNSATLQDIHTKRNSQRNSQIRDNARRIYNLSEQKLACAVCGYDVHVEICHIKAIADFNSSALISDINHIDNLIALCPNHHWEFDNNGLIISIR